jgi:hypothetical protein
VFRLKIHRVAGCSMCPAMDHNDYVVCALWPGYRAKVGSVVVVAHPRLNTIVKRVQCVDSLGRLQLSGDHVSSTSSGSMGWVDKEHVIGRVIFCISV